MVYGLKREYFNYLCSKICDESHNQNDYKRLLQKLHATEFTFVLDMDENRALDGVDLRYRFLIEDGSYSEKDILNEIDNRPCSVLEMMVGLALRCEEDIMFSPAYGDRTSHWFWSMINSLGLGGQDLNLFNSKYVDLVLHDFLTRKYQRNGFGGLFTTSSRDIDMRKLEIWTQLMLYLDENFE